MRIIGNDQKNNGQNFWEILERIIGKISSIIGAGLTHGHATCFTSLRGKDLLRKRGNRTPANSQSYFSILFAYGILHSS